MSFELTHVGFTVDIFLLKIISASSFKPDPHSSKDLSEITSSTSTTSTTKTKMEVDTVTCFLCNGTINFKNRDPMVFNAHMRDQHNIFYRTDYILASCFMQGYQLDKVEEDWANMERMEDVIEVDQDQNVEQTSNGLNFEMLDDQEVHQQAYDEVGVEVEEVVQHEEVLPMEEEGEGRKRNSNGPHKCDICEKTYGAKQNLARHYRKTHSLDGMKRERTEMESGVEYNFQTEEAQEIQQQTNSAKKRKPNNGEFKCGQCEHTYSTMGNLNVHMKKVHGMPAMKKERVEVETEDELAGYESDANSTTGEYPSEAEKIACELCARTFKSPGRLSYHRMTKHKDEVEGSLDAEDRRTISCEQCPKKFVSKTGLRWHRAKHDNVPMNTDGATTDDGESSKVEEEAKKSHPCLHCTKGYMSIQALVRHTRVSHGEDGGEVVAEQNNETEQNISMEPNEPLESNSEEVAASKEFVCAYGCGKSYSHKGTRDNHEIKEHNRALKKRGRGKAPEGSTFHLSSQEEELVVEEEVADVSEVVDAEVEAAQNNLAQMEEELAKAKEFVTDATEDGGQEEVVELENEEEAVANEEVVEVEEADPDVSFNPLPADPREEWRETQPITAEEERRFEKTHF